MRMLMQRLKTFLDRLGSGASFQIFALRMHLRVATPAERRCALYRVVISSVLFSVVVKDADNVDTTNQICAHKFIIIINHAGNMMCSYYNALPALTTTQTVRQDLDVPRVVCCWYKTWD